MKKLIALSLISLALFGCSKPKKKRTPTEPIIAECYQNTILNFLQDPKKGMTSVCKLFKKPLGCQPSQGEFYYYITREVVYCVEG